MLLTLKKVIKTFGYWIYVFLVVIILLELLLRLLQYAPYHYHPFSIQSEPSQSILPDSILGFKLNPGQYKVTINQDLTFELNHINHHQRITPTPTNPNYQIHVHGCSYTYGFGISDSLACAFRLQELLGNEIEVQGKAVLGYGTVQSYLLLKEDIRRGNIPDLAIINYASFHDDRNVLTPNYRKDLKNGFANANPNMQELYQSLRFPYVVLEQKKLKVKWDRWDDIYQNWPYREQSVLINLLQTISDRFTASHYQKEQLTKQLFLEIKRLCDEHHIKLLITGITKNDHTQALLQFCQANGINNLDISLDLLDKQYHNFPHDSHPNAVAHEHFAQQIAQYLQLQKAKSFNASNILQNKR